MAAAANAARPKQSNARRFSKAFPHYYSGVCCLVRGGRFVKRDRLISISGWQKKPALRYSARNEALRFAEPARFLPSRLSQRLDHPLEIIIEADLQRVNIVLVGEGVAIEITGAILAEVHIEIFRLDGDIRLNRVLYANAEGPSGLDFILKRIVRRIDGSAGSQRASLSGDISEGETA